MRKASVLFLWLISVHLSAQSYPIVSIIIVLPSNPDAITDNWVEKGSLLTITASTKPVNGRIDSRVMESKILVNIKNRGSNICGAYTVNSAPASNFNEATKVWSGSNAVALLGKGCVLPPGEYEICVQFFGNDAKGFSPFSAEICKRFSIAAKDQPVSQRPKTIIPENNPAGKETDIKSQVIIKERQGEPTNIVKERPGEPTNAKTREPDFCNCGNWGPIVVNKIKYDCSSRIPGNCNRRFQFSTFYQCSAANESCQAKTAWEITKDGVVIQTGNGSSNIDDAFTPAGNGIYTVTLQAFCNVKKCRPCVYYIVVEDCVVIATGAPSRYCDGCKGKSTTFGAGSAPNITYGNSGSVAVNSTVTHIPGKVFKVTAEIVDMERMGERGCLRCTKESREFGNFTGGSLNSYAGNIVNGANGYGKQIQWQYTSPTLISNFSYDLAMMFPPLTEAGCCKDSLRICTRWSFTDEKCITCDTLICTVITREYKKPDGLILSATFKNLAQIDKMGEPFISWRKQESDELPKDLEEQSKKLYDQRKEKEIDFLTFLESIKAVFYSIRQLQPGPNIPHQLFNTMCGNGDFETGSIDPEQWQGAFASLYTDPPCWACPNNLYTPWVPGFFPADGTPVNSPVGVASNHHTIVSAGPDPNFPLLLNTVPDYPSGNQYALRLGNSFAGFGAEKIEKTFIVPSSNNTLTFWYASVFYDANHENLEPAGAPSFRVRVYDATNTPVPNLVYLDPTNTPKDAIIANLANPFFINAGIILSNSVRVIRQWTCAKIDLSSLANQTVRIEFINTDCGSGGHYGYTYLDNFCLGSEANPSGNVAIQPINSCVKEGGQICVKYNLPKVGTATGTGTIKLQFYSNGSLIPYSITSPGLSTPTGTYCFTIDPLQLPCVNGMGGFDVTATGNFNMTVGNKTTVVTVTSPGIIGIPGNVQGIKPGVNNDLLCCINETDNCCTGFVKKVTTVVSMVGNTNAGYNAIKFVPTFRAGPRPIKQVRISIVNFESTATNKECLSCESNIARYGTISVPQGFTGGGKDAIEGMVYPAKPVSQPCFPMPCAGWNTLPSSEVTWGNNNNPGYNLMDGIGDQTTSFTISLPKKSTLSCCDDTIKICIKYSFTDVDCKTCDTVICYKIINRNAISITTIKSLVSATGNKQDEERTEPAVFFAMIKPTGKVTGNREK